MLKIELKEQDMSVPWGCVHSCLCVFLQLAGQKEKEAKQQRSVCVLARDCNMLLVLH